MSETAVHGSDSASASADASLFSAVEIEQFGADDVQAGGAIGKMLSALFFYTVIAMGIAGWWTWSSVNAHNAEAAASQNTEHSGHAEHGAAHN